MKLLCIPYAGGSGETYHRFRRYLPQWVDIIPFNPPGHGSRFQEPLTSSYSRMAREMYCYLIEIIDVFTDPFAFLGHSMGASLAFLITQFLEEEKRVSPRHLFVSGSVGPEVSSKLKGVYKLGDREFVQALKRLGGLPDSVTIQTEILDLFLPVLRSDFLAASEFIMEPPEQKISVPITAYLGENDTLTHGIPSIWGDLTSARYRELSFPGNHFFWLKQLGNLADDMGNMLKIKEKINSCSTLF